MIGLLKIKITNEDFVCAAEVEASSENSVSKAFATAKQVLSTHSNEAAYVVLPMENGKWMLLSYVPPNAVVRDKMVYASSRSSLKDGLNKALFIEDYFFSDLSDCTYENYQQSLRGDAADVMTLAERTAAEEAHASLPMNVKAVALPSLPLEITPSADHGINSIKANSSSVFIFTLSHSTQALHAEERKFTQLFPDLTNHLRTLSEPCYILFNFTHDAKSMTMFVYYCPDSSDRKFRMVYASCKSRMLEVCEKLSVNIVKKFEVDIPDDVNERAIMDELFPKVAEKQTFAKPARPGKGQARMT